MPEALITLEALLTGRDRAEVAANLRAPTTPGLPGNPPLAARMMPGAVGRHRHGKLRDGEAATEIVGLLADLARIAKSRNEHLYCWPPHPPTIMELRT